jgi:1-acyl-sn-glycerol-3-phosphate acyltransferase
MMSVAYSKDMVRFYEKLRETGAYETAPNRNPCAGWLLKRSDLWFYLRQFRVVWGGSLVAMSGRFNGSAWTVRAYRILRLLEKSGARIVVEGARPMIALDTPAVYVANHMSMIETMLLPGGLIRPFHPVSVVVKESLLRYPVFGRIMRAVEPIAVTRRHPRDDLKKVLGEGADLLRNGRSALIFPQATRCVRLDPASFNSLGVKLARRAQVPILPVALQTDFQGTGRRWRDFGPLDRSRPVRFAFGTPLPPDADPRDVQRHCVDFIAGKLNEWQETMSAAPSSSAPLHGPCSQET